MRLFDGNTITKYRILSDLCARKVEWAGAKSERKIYILYFDYFGTEKLKPGNSIKDLALAGSENSCKS